MDHENLKEEYKEYSGIISKYGNSLRKTLSTLYPNFNWGVFEFEHFVSDESIDWKDVQIQNHFLKLVEKQLGMTNWKDWYKVTKDQLKFHGGNRRNFLRNFACRSHLVLELYENNHVSTITGALPEYPFLFWKFESCPYELWKEKKNQRIFMEYLRNEFKIRRKEGNLKSDQLSLMKT